MDNDTSNLSEQPLEHKQTKSGPPKWKRFVRRFAVSFVLVLIFSIYWYFFKKYAEGERTGILIKITHKGNIFKTDEGEMWLSCRQVTNPEKFFFSVRSDSLAKVLRDLQDECVQLNYTQYLGALPWRGDSKYIVTGVRPIAKPQ